MVKTTPLKSGKGIVWADQRRCDWWDKNDVIDPGIYSRVKRFFVKRMETDKYLTLISGTHNVDGFTVRFTDELIFGEDWEVALVQAYLPHRDSHFQESFKKYFPNNKVVGGLAVHYNTSNGRWFYAGQDIGSNDGCHECSGDGSGQWRPLQDQK